MTLYRLGDIQPNPFRNMDNYPINREKVEALKASIGRTDFWDNLVARESDGKPQIAYGHHRMVALRELFPADHPIDLIVRDLDDAAMLHIMADENMQEWRADSAVIVETVRAVRDFLGAGPGKVSTGGRPPKADNGDAIKAFLGWPEYRVHEALAILNAEDAGVLRPEDTAGLGIEQAAELRRAVAAPVYRNKPELRRETVARVRADLNSGAIGKRGVADLARQIREEAAPPAPAKVPEDIAKGIYNEIDGFWRVAIRVNGTPLTRPQIIRLIAENRAALELQYVTGPWAQHIATALDEMAGTARELAEALRAENAVEVV